MITKELKKLTQKHSDIVKGLTDHEKKLLHMESELRIKGTKKYIKYLSEHLKEEHPTKKRMTINL